MKRALCLILLLAACKEDEVDLIAPVTMSTEALGYYCQMNLSEHPGPKAQVHLDGMPGAPLFFSQVRDALAYSRMPEQSHAIRAIYVSDMGAKGATWDLPGLDNWIASDAAFYVEGSTLMGGMGAPELIPFGDFGAAEVFVGRHGGVILQLDAIPDAVLLGPLNDTAPDSDFEKRLKALADRAGG